MTYIDRPPVLTGKQTHVLNNLHRVRDRPYKLNVQFPVRRYQLDGQDCTQQIHGLTVKGFIAALRDGSLQPVLQTTSA